MQNCILIWNAYTYFYWVPISSNLNTKLGTCIYLILTQCLVSGKEKTIVGKILMFVLLRKKIRYNWNSNYLLFTFFFLSNFPLDYLSPTFFPQIFWEPSIAYDMIITMWFNSVFWLVGIGKTTWIFKIRK